MVEGPTVLSLSAVPGRRLVSENSQPVLMYGCETWKMNKCDENKIDVFQSRCLRRIFKIRWQERIGLLQLTITWYKIRHAGGQAHYYSPTGTLKQRQVKFDWFRSLCFNVPVGE